MKKIIPRAKQVLVKPQDEESRQSESGLFIPDNIEQEQRAIGKVIAVGKDITDIEKGDTVIYGAYAGETIKLNEKGKNVEYKILFDEDVVAKLED